MDTLLFDNQPKDENDILKLAKKEKFDVEKLKIDANSDETKKILQDDIQAAIDLQIYATPSVVIGSVIHKGMMPYDEFKKILLKAGAEKK